MVRLAIVLKAASARGGQELLGTFRFLMASTKQDPGCEECTAWSEADGRVHYVESWASEPDLRRHVQSAQFKQLLAVMECASEPPDVQFDFVTVRRGLDYVAEVRGEGRQ
jgi:quinol monooxygenase YgiN